jgi:hypothetical protein
MFDQIWAAEVLRRIVSILLYLRLSWKVYLKRKWIMVRCVD